MPTPLIYTIAAIIGYRGFLALAMVTTWNAGPLVVMFCLDLVAFAALAARSLVRARSAFEQGLLPRRPTSAIATAWLVVTTAFVLWLVQGGFPVLVHTTVGFVGEFNWVVACAAWGIRFWAEWWAETQLPAEQRRWADARAVAHTLLRIAPVWLPSLITLLLVSVLVGELIGQRDVLQALEIYNVAWVVPVVTVTVMGLVELTVSVMRQHPTAARGRSFGGHRSARGGR